MIHLDDQFDSHGEPLHNIGHHNRMTKAEARRLCNADGDMAEFRGVSFHETAKPDNMRRVPDWRITYAVHALFWLTLGGLIAVCVMGAVT